MTSDSGSKKLALKWRMAAFLAIFIRIVFFGPRLHYAFFSADLRLKYPHDHLEIIEKSFPFNVLEVSSTLLGA